MANCTPPFCMGTGGCGNCNCNCCPPDPCYTKWTYRYYCGTTSDDWDTNIAPSNIGCVCPSPALPFIASNLDIEFPDFTYTDFAQDFKFNVEDTKEAEIYAMLVAGCSIPCRTITIEVTTSGCCLYKTGSSDTEFKAIGGGTVTAAITGGDGDVGNESCGGIFEVTINDSPNSATVLDCDTVIIEITPPSAITCCSCCKFDSTGTRLTGSGPWTLRRAITSDGRSKLLLNPAALKQNLINRILKSKQ